MKRNVCAKPAADSPALVTGADSGIGLCFCRELARAGHPLVMVSNRPGPLASTASALSTEFGVKTWPLECDLAAPDAAEWLHREVGALGIEPEILVNNAGIFSFAPVAETDPRRLDLFIDLHVRAVTGLCRLFGADMARRGSGYILNMSSMSCWMPMPGIAMYAATKAYIRVFSRALHLELADSGVGVTVATPGGIATSLFGLPDNLKRLAVGLGVLDTPERFARKALRRMFARRQQYINGVLNRISIAAVGSTPRRVRMLVKRLMLDKNIRV